MISYAIRYIAAPLLGHVGSALLHAGREESDRADAAELNEARLEGRLHEARMQTTRYMAISDGASQNLRDAQEQIATMAKRIEQLEEVERNGLAEDEVYQHTAATLQDTQRELAEVKKRCDRLTAKAATDDATMTGLVAESNRRAAQAHDLQTQLDAAHDTGTRLTAERDIAQHEAATLRKELAAARAEVAPVEAERCAWCLGPSDSASGRPDFALCAEHGHPLQPPCYDDICARVAARAASCLARRVADPLAIACPTCLVPIGEECDGLGFKRSVARSMAT